MDPDYVMPDYSIVPDPRSVIPSNPCDIGESGWSPDEEEEEVRVFLISGPQRSGKTMLSKMIGADVAFDHESIAVTCGQVYHAAITARRITTIVVEAVDPYDIASSLRDLCSHLDGVSFRHISISN